MKLSVLTAMLLVFGVPSLSRTIDYDLGGSVISYGLAAADHYEQIIIRGTCASACTMFIGRENTCIGRNARLGFHGPYATKGQNSRAEFDRISLFMAGFYPPKIAAWFMKKARFVGPNEVIWLTYEDAIEMGVKACRL